MTLASPVRATASAAALAVLLLLDPNLTSAQQQQPTQSEAGQPRTPFQAPVGHRQPRAADIPVTEKTEAELQAERQQAELNRRLKICRGC